MNPVRTQTSPFPNTVDRVLNNLNTNQLESESEF
jgi:hypothetical protein